MSDVTQILSRVDRGDSRAAEQLLPLVYKELHQLAEARMAKENPGQTLQATALVHEAYVRLVDVQHRQKWNSTGHFFSAAAEAMRRILIEQARRKSGPKAGGDCQRVELSHANPEIPETDGDIETLNETLRKLATEHPRSAEVVKLRFFAGLTIHQTADTLGISIATAKNDWAYARGWLRAEMLDADAARKEPS